MKQIYKKENSLEILLTIFLIYHTVNLYIMIKNINKTKNQTKTGKDRKESRYDIIT